MSTQNTGNPASGSPGLDVGAAVTRSLLGWGAVAGAFYLVFGLVLAVTRPGFDLSQHALSLLLLGRHGWLQLLNLVLSGLMTLAAAIGFSRLPNPSRLGAALVGVYGGCVVLSAVFPPDAVAGFPPGSVGGTASAAGMLHLAFGGIGFLCLAAAAFALARWFARLGKPTIALWSKVAGALVVTGFLAGAALSEHTAGVAALWMAVVAGWAWLAAASISAYRLAPHPVLALRTAG